MAKIVTKKIFRITIKRKIKTEFYPAIVANNLEALLASQGFKRSAQKSTEEFIWENDKREKFGIEYYTKVNSISNSILLDEDKTPFIKNLSVLFNNLNTIIGMLSQHLGFPYLSSTREVMLEIQGKNPEKKAQAILPLMRELYKKEEGIQIFNEDLIEQTDANMQFLFSLPEF